MFKSKITQNSLKMLHIQTSCVNNPEFIEMQDLLFKKFLIDDYQFTVFNHGKDYPDCSNYYDVSNDYKNKIRTTCDKLNIECIDVIDEPWYKGNPSAGTASAMNFILDNYHKVNPGKYFVIDSDMFLVNPMSTSKYDEYDAVYRTCVRNEYRYMWNGIYYFNTDSMKNLDLLNWNQFQYTETNPHPGYGLYTDTGGLTYPWVHEEKPNHNTKEIDMLESCGWNRLDAPEGFPENLLDFCDSDPRRYPNGRYFSEIYEDVIFHYRAGGNWEGRSKGIHDHTKNNLMKCLSDLVH